MRSFSWLTVTLGFLSACTPRTGASGGGACNDFPLDLPAPAAEPFVPRDSTVLLSADVPLSAILSRVEKEAPRQLAAEKGRDIGAAGRADFVVRRGTPSLRADGKTLELDVPVDATIDVCKPLGSMCLGYGHCEPAFTARFKTEARLDGFDWPDLRSSIRVEKRCVIAIDVTDQIVALAERELSRIEKRLEKSLPPLEPSLERALAFTRAPLALPDGSCLQVTPRESFYVPPRVDNGRFRLGVGIIGHVERPADCQSRSTTTRPSAPRAVETAPAAPTVELPFLLESSQLEARLSEQLVRESQDGLQIRHVGLTPRGDGALVRLELAGDFCGALELLAEPDFDAELSRLVWKNLRFATSVPDDLRRAVSSTWTRSASLDLADLKAKKQSFLAAWDAELKRSLPRDVPVRLTRSTGPSDRGRAVTTSTGVVVAFEVPGTFQLDLLP